MEEEKLIGWYITFPFPRYPYDIPEGFRYNCKTGGGGNQDGGPTPPPPPPEPEPSN